MTREHDELVLSIVPTHRGLAYTLFRAPLSPIDWGFKRIRGKDKNAHCLAAAARLCEALRPETLIIEDCFSRPSRRSERAKRLITMMARLSEAENITLARYTQAAVFETFKEAGAVSRTEIAHAIAAYVPALASYLPRPRKLWSAEDERLFLFDAAALALTHYAAVPAEGQPP